MAWQTFWLEPTGTARRALRRYATPPPSPGYESRGWTCEAGWHDAMRWIGGEVDQVLNEHGCRDVEWGPAPAHDDPTWPAECDDGCGYRFVEDDNWQTWQEPLYRRGDTGELRVLHWKFAPPGIHVAEPGAMWDGPWLPNKGPDGIALIVRCPRPDGSDGTNDWAVDEEASTGGFWCRNGDPCAATVTVTPSIAIGLPDRPGHYHGFLTNGVLTDPLD